MVLMSASLCAFAQTDYVAQAQVNIKKYYPQYEEYFKPIFAEYKVMGQNANRIFNQKIQENFDTFEEELTSERDKCATILTSMDDLLGDKTFINGKKQVDSSDGEDLINGIAKEITFDIKLQYSRELNESKDRLAKAKDRLAKAEEEIRRIKKVREKVNASNGNPKDLLLAIEELFEVSEVSGVKDSPGTQEIIKYYITKVSQVNIHSSRD
jgi:hypothetical protein